MSSDQGGESRLLQEEADPGPKTCGEEETPLGIGGGSGGMVTSKGAGLNPNAKVWQEAPADGPNGAQWPPADITDGYSESVPSTGCKLYRVGFTTLEDSSSSAAATAEITVNGMDPPDLAFTPAETTTGTSGETKLTEAQPLSSENLTESLKKELEFYFSRENLSKDLYLMSQMDSDQFVPIWTIASMESIKALTTDMELILDVLRSSPMVQVDEQGEKVRPDHKRCIIILREVPETTPVEEVEALFKSDDCPKVISVEFAHNNSWYITFQSDTDAQQAHRYLREEVKTFQGKPIMARIKAINTFFAKNGYRSMDSSMYTAQQSAQTQTQYNPNLYMQHVYSPQQQYPLYGIVPQTWTTSPTPYFETPLAPFPNSGFVNGFSSPVHYKTGNNTLNITRPFNRYRNHVKPQVGRTGEVTPTSVAPVPLERLTGLRSPHTPTTTTTGPVPLQTQTPPDLTSTFPHLSSDPNDDGSMSVRGRRTTYRGTRKRREDERITRSIPLTEVKVVPPKFDLAATNFPPLPGCVASTQGEPVLENRMSDVVRGLNRDKTTEQANKEVIAGPASASAPLQPPPQLQPPPPPQLQPPPQDMRRLCLSLVLLSLQPNPPPHSQLCLAPSPNPAQCHPHQLHRAPRPPPLLPLHPWSPASSAMPRCASEPPLPAPQPRPPPPLPCRCVSSTSTRQRSQAPAPPPAQTTTPGETGRTRHRRGIGTEAGSARRADHVIETVTSGMDGTTATMDPRDREALGASSSMNRDGVPNQPDAAPPKEAPDTLAKSRTSPRYRQSKTSDMNDKQKNKCEIYMKCI